MPFSKVPAHIYMPVSLLQEHFYFRDWTKLPDDYSISILAMEFEEIPFIFWNSLIFRLRLSTPPVIVVVFVIIRGDSPCSRAL